MFINASRICCVGTCRRFSHLRRPLYEPNWISSVSIAPKSVSNLKLAISSWLTPISLRQSSNRPTQSLNVPIFATLPGIRPQPFPCSAGLMAPGIPSTALRASLPAVLRSCRLNGDRGDASAALLCLERCRTLLHVRRQTFLGVFALEQQLLIFALQGQRGFHRNFPSRLHRALDASNGFRCLIGRAELGSIFHDVFHEILALVNVVDDPQLFRFFERKSVPGDHQFDGLALAH